MAVKLEELVLEIKVQNDQLIAGLNKATKKVDSFGKKTTKTFSKVKSSAAAVAVSMALIGVAANKLSGVIIRFEKLEASLKTVTGSAEKADKAFAQITQFAATTPFQLEEVVASFIKLKALGLDPSEKALRSYGNTASALGKSLNQMIEAVADATTGEFERLKEFGIKAKSQGDQVSFTFQGITTTVRKNAKEITTFLQSIGEVNFAGAMAEQADTLGVATSNMGDAIDQLAVTIGDAGVTEIFKDMALAVTDGAKAMDAFIERTFILNENVKALGFESEAQFDKVKNFVNLFNEQQEGLGGVPTPQMRPEGEFEEKLEKMREQASIEQDLEKEKQERLQEIISESQSEITKRTSIFLEKLNALEKLSGEQKVRVGVGAFQDMLSEAAKHNKALFEINKVAGVANAVISTAQGVAKALELPFPLNLAAGAAVAAAGAAQIATITSQQFGGGAGAVSSPATSVPSAPAVESGGGGGANPQPRGVDISVAGIGEDDLFTGKMVRALIGKFNDEFEDGSRLNSIGIS